MAMNGGGKIVLGICAMEKKVNAKPMKKILAYIEEYYGEWIQVFKFAQSTILEKDISEWEICDALLAFSSNGFPLGKACEYAKLRKPYLLQDLDIQFDLFDRTRVYELCRAANVPTPKFIKIVREHDAAGNVFNEDDLVETMDNITVNGELLPKPFVEKPLDAENHNVIIYFPGVSGGGSQRLFRKVGNQSSAYSKECDIRTDGSYVYEEFIAAEGIDVKVYAVGSYYIHAEARKAPGLDGVVERDHNGKEIRYPVILTQDEKVIAGNIVGAFKQTICGFDLLRSGNKSYVCDVNGCSFVKSSGKYYSDCAKVLGGIVLKELASHLHIPYTLNIDEELDPIPKISMSGGRVMELRCVLAVVRHGDRTPKQKLKLTVDDRRLYDIFVNEGGLKKGEIKLKRPKKMQLILDCARDLFLQSKSKCKELSDMMLDDDNDSISPEQLKDFKQKWKKLDKEASEWDNIRSVLETGGSFSGINRKVQIKSKSISKLIDKNKDTSENTDTSLLIVVKWGGELTKAGIMQAESLGRLFRTLYPAMSSDGTEDNSGMGFLRLHSTFRHDLKIYASDEGRVQMTAAAFTRGLLALEGELPPILAQMVKSANTDGLLDDDREARHYSERVKSFLHVTLQMDKDLTSEDMKRLNPLNRKSLHNALVFIKNPRKICIEILGYVDQLNVVVDYYTATQSDRLLYQMETWSLAGQRWRKLMNDFGKVKGNKTDEVAFDISKIPDIYDNLKYDMEHNPDLTLQSDTKCERFYQCVKAMADVLVPMEYGICADEKLSIAQGICSPLIQKLRSDFQAVIENSDENQSVRLNPIAARGISTPGRHVRTRLYFTSESHLHTVMNMLQYGQLGIDKSDQKWKRAKEFLSNVSEFNYMTQIVFMLYEDRSKPENSPDRFHVSLHFSPGLYPCFYTDREKIYQQTLNTSCGKTKTAKTLVAGHHEHEVEPAIAIVPQPKLPQPSPKLLDAVHIHRSAMSTPSLNSIREDATSLPRGQQPLIVAASPERPVTTDSEDEANNNYNKDNTRIRKSSLVERPWAPKHHEAVTLPYNPDKEQSEPLNPKNEEQDAPSKPRQRVNSAGSAQYRKHFPYQFKHHAVNMMNDVVDRFINSTVIGGEEQRESMDMDNGAPAILNTAIYGVSAHQNDRWKLLSLAGHAGEKIQLQDIRRFWPPLRSLETLHDAIPSYLFDEFMQNVVQAAPHSCDVFKHRPSIDATAEQEEAADNEGLVLK